MIYQCQKCGLSKSASAMGSVLPQCKCDWQPTPMIQKPAREWVGLTDEEMLEAYGFRVAPGLPPFIAQEAKQELLGALRKVEAKLKEKNT